MFDQLGLFVGNDFSTADNGVDKVFGHLERRVVAVFEFKIVVVVALKIMESDGILFILVSAIRYPGGNELVVLGQSTL